MTFPTVVFGNYEVGQGYADGASIDTGGLRVFVVPTKNISIPMDIGITYVDQFGNTKTTTVTTSIPTATGGGTTGAHFMIVLNSGDSGIRDVISISVVGGAIGDKFNLESWNEGIGRTAYSITRSTPDQPWIDSEPTKDVMNFARTFSSWEDFNNAINENIVVSGSPDAQLSLPIDVIEPDYESNVNDFGLMRPITLVTKYNSLKKLRIELIPSQSYTSGQSTSLKWKWDTSTSQYIDTGFYKLTFDYNVQFRRENFVFELLDKDGTVTWNTPTGTGQYTAIVPNYVASFKSLSWEFRLRCKLTNAPSTADYAQVTNIRIERYIAFGSTELNYPVGMPNIDKYNNIDIVSNNPAGTGVFLQLAFSDDLSTWSTWTGPDGTMSTYFIGIGQKIFFPLPFGLIGNYYKWKIYLQSDGRDTPILYDTTLHMSIRIIPKILKCERSLRYPDIPANQIIQVPIPLRTACPRAIPGYPFPPCPGGDYFPEQLTGNEYIPISYPFIRLCPRTTPGYPTVQCPGGDYFSEQPTGKQLTARMYTVFKTWLESVVGQVVSGYVQNISGDVIRNAFSLILMSTTPTEITPGGTSAVMNVNPDTGLYQAFLKSIIYDKRYIIIKIGVKNVALEGAGTPPFIDGSQKLEIPYNLQFACPVIDCDFNITRKV